MKYGYDKKYQDYENYRARKELYDRHHRRIDQINNAPAGKYSDEYMDIMERYMDEIDKENERERIEEEKLNNWAIKWNLIIGIGIFVFLLAVSDKGQIVIKDFLDKIEPFLPFKK